MKIVTWNINGYRSISGQNPSKRYDKVTKENKLFEYVENEKPDILMMQETKANEDQINEELRCPPGYHAYYHSCEVKKGYSGTAIFTKEEPKEIIRKFGIDRFDGEGRVLGADFGEFIIFNVYFPKGYADSERLTFKLDFYDEFFDYVEKLRSGGRKIIVSGDYNTAHNEIDLARPKQNTGTSGFMPEERVKLDELQSRGWVDAFRKFEKENGHYTWWSQRGRARENNVGWRIDYHWLTEDLLPNLKNAYQQPEQTGSDHCPVVAEMEF